jgi:post-segregation antitoxin (ccd killing protein)
MARVNAYLPDDLAAAARAAGLNVSAVLQAALRQELAATSFQAWYRAARAALPATPVPSALAGTTLRGVREDDFGA